MYEIVIPANFRVRSFILTVTFSRTGNTWKKTTGPGKSWKSAQLKKYRERCFSSRHERGTKWKFLSPREESNRGAQKFFLCPTLVTRRKASFSVFLYRAQNFPSLLFYFQAMQLSEFVRNVCRPWGELILKSWEWTGLRWNLESWKNRSRSLKGPLNFVFEKRYETCNQANVHFRATLSTIFYQTWLVVYQTPTVVLKRNPSETSWGMNIYRMNLYNNWLRYCNRNCILKYKS